MSKNYNDFDGEYTETEYYHERMISCLSRIASDIHFFRILVQIILIIVLFVNVLGIVISIWVFANYAQIMPRF